MRPFTVVYRRNWFFIFALIFLGRHSPAQQNNDQYADVDVRLNTIYQQAIGSLPLNDQLAMQEAHTAWIKFKEATGVALAAQQSAGYLTSEDVKIQALKEENQHINHLQAFFLGGQIQFQENTCHTAIR